MKAEINIIDRILIVRLQGELDHHAVEDARNGIEQTITEGNHQKLVLSFQNIDFMDSSGLGLILGRYRTISQRGGEMALCEVGGNLRKIFELSGILKIIPVYETEAEACRALGRK
ncbi:anti-sigma F factor antagonist [Alicyclobacillaceae bacterium I2511]|nr:anti-sigma F factor antagonist [Alicyclobacillaceae bacterium I2511]